MVTIAKTTDTSPADKQTAQDKEQPTKIEKQARQRDALSAKNESTEKKAKNKARPAKQTYPNPSPRLSISQLALKKFKLVAVAYSNVEREFFPTEEAYYAEKEVEGRAAPRKYWR